MLSLPFQQTARFVSEYESEITDEERAVIDRVLIYDQLAIAIERICPIR